MSNAKILFFPIRSPITPAPDPVALYELNVTLLRFAPTVDVNSRELTTLAGRYSRKTYFTANNYQIEIAEGEYFDDLGDQVGEDAINMFLQSVRSGEVFYITNIDDNDSILDVQLTGRWSKNRVSAADVAKFRYTFTVREVLQ